MKIGIYGGSFDPIHIAHLILAECAADQLGLDLVLFVPAKLSPLKQNSTPTEDKHRLEMLRLATGGNARFSIDTLELDRGGVSYTIDSVRQLKSGRPEAEFWLLLGEDSLNDFEKWNSPAELLTLTQLGVMARPSLRNPEGTINWSVLERLGNGRSVNSMAKTIVAPLLQISSSALREHVRLGRSIRYQVPAAVEAYIRQEKLYGQH